MIETAAVHHIVSQPSRPVIEEETNYNDVEYQDDSFEPTSGSDYYDENADR